MIKHIVMWKFKPGKEAEMNEFLDGLRALFGVIPQIEPRAAAEVQVPGGGA